MKLNPISLVLGVIALGLLLYAKVIGDGLGWWFLGGAGCGALAAAFYRLYDT